jgi:hypothetical protein
MAVLRGAQGDDTLLGGSGADRLSGNGGHDVLFGGAGNDQFFTALTRGKWDTIDGGTGQDSLCITLNSAQLARGDVKAALAALNTFLTHTVPADPTAHFISNTLHLDLTGVERASVRVDGVVKTLAEVGARAGASVTTVTVHGTDSIFDHTDHISGPGATSPIVIDLGTGTGRVATLSDVAGTFVYTFPDAVPFLSAGPDGSIFYDANYPTLVGRGTQIDPAGGIAGVSYIKSGMLMGVFLDGNENAPDHVIPATLDFNASGTNFAQLTPGIDQPFFLGDGLTGTGSGAQQKFLVPDGATKLVLGVADAGAMIGYPATYDDNSGSVVATVTVYDNVWHL